MERVYIETTIPSLVEIREVRRKISAECGHDAQRLAAHYKKVEEKLRADGRYQFIEADEAAPEPTVLNDKPKK